MNQETLIKNTETQMQAHKTDIESLIKQVAKTITPVWPIETFIACNPLHGFEDKPFADALYQSQTLYSQNTESPGLAAVNFEMIKWSGAFLDMGQGSIEMPNREQGFYQNFCDLAVFDRKLHQGDKSKKTFIADLPGNPADAIILCLNLFKIASKDYHDFLLQNFAYLPGWSGYVKWLSLWQNSQHLHEKFPINLSEYMAVRLIITYLLWPEIALEKKKGLPKSSIQQQLQLIENNETLYQQQLIKQLSARKEINKACKRPDLQMVFCIDVRSEPFRRQLEKKGHYETLGFAGFFGLAVRIHEAGQKTKDCCPALITPQYEIEKQLHASQKEIERYQERQDFLDSFVSSYQQLKYNFVTPFNLADAMGPWCGIAMLMRNFFPGFFETTLNRLKQHIQAPIETEISPKLHGQFGIIEQEQVKLALGALKLMGLVNNFAKVVIFCGHKSTTSNNPYASALDCGACGGNHGDQNARLLANILNQKNIRQALKAHDIHIPEDTLFLGAVHDTTSDACDIFHDSSNQQHEALLKKIKLDLKLTQEDNIAYRQQFFNQPEQTGVYRTHNWSELRPEWGLARNAAFIIGPRDLTCHTNLNGRSFLHSYDWQIDNDGSLLETILTAPMVVAQWINTQYLFSTLDNTNFGSGNKITHNVVGKLGVMQGNSSDLMHGLALQSVNKSTDKAFHSPQRLLTIVYAPMDFIMSIINRQPILQKLFYNEWVHLMAFCPHSSRFYRLNKDKSWTEVSCEGE